MLISYTSERIATRLLPLPNEQGSPLSSRNDAGRTDAKIEIAVVWGKLITKRGASIRSFAHEIPVPGHTCCHIHNLPFTVAWFDWQCVRTIGILGPLPNISMHIV